MTTAEREKTIWDHLTAAGLTPAGAAGLMGNLYAESGLEPCNLENTYEKKLCLTDATYTAAVDAGTYTNFANDRAGYGLAQWTYPTRKYALLAFVRAAGKSVGDLETQLTFLLDELAVSYPAVLNTLKATNSIRAASDIVLLKFECPADQSAAVKEKRAGYGQAYFDQYAPAAKLLRPGVLEIAAGELGNTEYPANSNRTKYGAWYGLDGEPWCMMFVQWCFHQAGLPLQHKSASCSDMLSWYRRYAPEKVVAVPKRGDIAIYNFGHTGIVESVSAGTITAIEGNTSDGDSGSQSNGGGVFRRTRSKALVTAYIRPFDDLDKDDKEEEEDMNQEKFNQMFKIAMAAYRKELRDNDSGTWSKEAREFAIASGLFAGSGTTPDGNPNYMWEDLLTREQCAQLFYRFAQRNGLV